MTPQITKHFDIELFLARIAWVEGRAEQSWRHLERAHILGQAFAWPHIVVHWHMLLFGLRRGDAREVLGQFVRIIVAGPGSLLGKAPVGNTGGANVGILTSMEIPSDLQAILNETESAPR